MPGNTDITPAVSTLDCPDCGLEQVVPELSAGMVAACCRCGGKFERRAGTSQDGALAFAAAGLLLLAPGNFLPLMILNFQGAERQGFVVTGVGALWDQEYHFLAALVAAFACLFPILWLGGLVTVLAAVRTGWQRPWLGRLFRITDTIRPWAMADVFLVGGFVAFTRLQAFAPVTIGPGGWAFLGAALAALAIDPLLDRRQVWEAIGADRRGAAATSDFACLGCGRRSTFDEVGRQCPRCGVTLRPRKPDSIVRTSAFVVAGYLLYVPANLLPVMTIVRFGRPEPNTILSGVRELLQLDMWPLALIVFMASIVIPLSKLAGLTWCLVSLSRGSPASLVRRTQSYRAIERVGRWSNIDIFMISLLAGLVQFGQLTRVLAEPGAIAFAAVVVVTMVASKAFDPRLMWDAAGATR